MLRKILLAMPVALIAFQSAVAQVGDPEPAYYEPSESYVFDSETGDTLEPCSECNASSACGGGECCCDQGRGRAKLLEKHRAKQQGRNSEWLWDSCNCNGSYKFPVPPLYTYFWPGLYSHRLMTDYHSPWRFPAIRPYEDEEPGDELSLAPPQVRQVSSRSSAAQPPVKSWPGGIEPVSAKMQRYYR